MYETAEVLTGLTGEERVALGPTATTVVNGPARVVLDGAVRLAERLDVDRDTGETGEDEGRVALGPTATSVVSDAGSVVFDDVVRLAGVIAAASELRVRVVLLVRLADRPRADKDAGETGEDDGRAT